MEKTNNRYLIIDDEGWQSCCAFYTIDEAIERSELLLTMEDWKNARFFYIKELNIETNVIHDIRRVYRKKEEQL